MTASSDGTPLLPVFLKLDGRRVVLVGGGNVAASKLPSLLRCRAVVTVVAPHVAAAVEASGAEVVLRPFRPGDLDGAFFAVAAATPEVNRQVAAAGEARGIFVNAVDDPSNATAYFGGVVRRGDVTFAISTGGRAPALTGLLREALDASLPGDLPAWLALAERERSRGRARRLPLSDRRAALAGALRLYLAGVCPPEAAT